MAAVATVGVAWYDVNWAYCRPSPKAPPAGMPLDTANADD